MKVKETEIIEKARSLRHRGHNLEYSIVNLICEFGNPHVHIIVKGYRWWKRTDEGLKKMYARPRDLNRVKEAVLNDVRKRHTVITERDQDPHLDLPGRPAYIGPDMVKSKE